MVLRDSAVRRFETAAAIAIIFAAGLAAYQGIFHAPFIFDDLEGIVKNPTIRHLYPPWDALATPPGGSGASGRPLTNVSLAVNYALGGLDVRGYHAFNLAIHILASLTLFGVVRRTLQIVAFASSTIVAFCVALLWTVHPLLTESVTFTIQRNESMMALFYLLTLYCFIRSIICSGNRKVLWPRPPEGHPPEPSLRDSAPPRHLRASRSVVGADARTDDENLTVSATRISSSGTRQRFVGTIWAVISIVACLFGMATKEVMVSAPLIVLLYDRTFVTGTFAEAWRRRRGYYIGLASTWLLLAYLVLRQRGVRGDSAGFGLGLSVATYALTQCWGIVHYLRLAFWPHPLVPEALLLLALLAATATTLVWRRPSQLTALRDAGGHAIGLRWIGFLGVCFFAILAPSSSVIPLPAQTVAEHRMYLPLAALLTAAVVGLRALLGRRTLLVCLPWAVGLGWLTLERNQDYRSEVAIWGTTAAQRPGNPRAQNNFAIALANAGRLPEAEARYVQALRIDPNYADAERNFGDLLRGAGRSAEAIFHYRQALRLQPNFAEAHNNLGAALGNQGRLAEAVAEFAEAVRLKPDYVEADRNLALARAALAPRWPR